MSDTRLPAIAIASAVASLVLAACGQLFMKAGMLEIGEIQNLFDRLQPPPISGVAWIAAGVLAYGSAILSWLPLLARVRLSVAYPLVSLSYALVYVGAVLWPRLEEQFSWGRTTGILLIIVGVWLVARNGRETRTHAGPEQSLG